MIPKHHINLSKQERVIIKKALFGLADISRDYTTSFENNFAKYIGVKYAVSASSARHALFIILRALCLNPGDEVILPAYSFWAVVEIVKSLQLVPVFAQINPDTYNIDCESAKRSFTSRSRVIIVEHIFGQPADLDPLVHIARENNLVLIEDCAQACGSEYHNSKVGSFGDFGYFSFAKGKNLTTISGGMITTNDHVLYERICRHLKAVKNKANNKSVLKLLFSGFIQHVITSYPSLYFPVGITTGLFFENNFQESPASILPQAVESSLHRLNNVLAHIGLVQLSRIDQLNRKRIDNTSILIRELNGIGGIKLQKQIRDTISTYSCFSIEIERNKTDQFARQLLFRGVDCRKDWMSYYLGDSKLKDLPDRILYVPNYPALDEKQLFLISAGIKDVMVQLNKR